MNIIRWQCLKILKNKEINKCCIHNFERTFSYKSAYCLENLYPNSKLNLYTPKFATEASSANFSGYIPIKELDITYSGSTGPGGQNVNRLNTKVDLRFNIRNASWLPDEIKEKLLEKYHNMVNKNGYLVLKSDLTRSQQLNLADALQKLRQMIRNVIVVPAEPCELTKEKYRKLQVKAAQERVFTKRIKSQRKRDRQGSTIHDFT